MAREHQTLTDLFNDIATSIINKKGGIERLPSEYQEVEYIQGTGTQYIDTLLKPYKTKTTIKFQYTEMIYEEEICGCYNVNENRYYVFGLYRGTSFIILDRANITKNTIPANTNINEVIYNDENNYVFYNGTNVATVSDLTNIGGNTITLFGRRNNASSVSVIAKAKIFNCQLYDKNTNTLVRDFIPCYRKSDNVIGMYDLVNDVFYTNSGTGTFLKGNDVNKIVADNFPSEIDDLNVFNYQEVSQVNGYIFTDGTIVQPSATQQEKTTDYIEVKNGDLVICNIDYYDISTTNQVWTAFGIYNQNKDFLYRVAYASSISADKNFNTINVCITQDGFVRGSYRSYGICTCYIYIYRNNKLYKIYKGI